MEQRKRPFLPIWASLLLVFLNFPLGVQAELVVIGHKDLAIDAITAEQARKIWLAKLHKLPGTGKLVVVDQATDSEAYHQFYRQVVKKKPKQIKAYWAKLAFTGKGFPPEKLDDENAVVEWVASQANGLGYVDRSAVDDRVKVLLSVQ